LDGQQSELSRPDGDRGQTAGINIIEWEIDNEPYVFPRSSHASRLCRVRVQSVLLEHQRGQPERHAGVFFQGQFLTLFGNYQTWDAGMQAYSPQYWQGVSFHVYPITDNPYGP
jgi:hypothetical protein